MSSRFIIALALSQAPAALAGSDISSHRLLVAIEDGGAVELEAQTGSVLNRFSTGPNAFGAAYSPDGRRAFVTDKTSGELLELNTADGSVMARLNVGTNPQQPAVTASGTIYIPLSGEAAIAVVDASAGLAPLRKIPTGDGTKPHIVSLSPEGDVLWVTVQGRDPKIMAFSITAGAEALLKEYRYDLVPRVVAAAVGGQAWFTAHHSTGAHNASVSANAATTPFVDAFGTSSEPRKQIEGVATFDDDRVALTHEGRKTAFVLERDSSLAFSKTCDVGLSGVPYWVTFDRGGKVIFVSIPGLGLVQALDAATCSTTPLWTANVGGKPKRMDVAAAAMPENRK